MNDKQKLALKELADVMEKHGITLGNLVWVGICEEPAIEMYQYNVTAKHLREELKA